MSDGLQKGYLAAVIGAGPAGMYASQALARQGVSVVLFNRDIRPGGLAEYGIFPIKHKMRQGLLTQFKRILRMPNIKYCGNVTVGQSGDIRLDQLRQAGFQAIMVTTGAQENNWLGLPGEDLVGVYQANDIVFHYNHLPERQNLNIDFGRNVTLIGMGNVMLDIAHYLKLLGRPRQITAFARRGPNEVKFDRQTLEPVANCLDLAAIKLAVDSAEREVSQLGSDVSGFYKLLTDGRRKAGDCDGKVHIDFHFLRSPHRLIGDDQGRVKGIVFEVNRLVKEAEKVEARGTGRPETVLTDSVIFSIGSRVDDGFGLPVAHGNYVTTPTPRFPVDGISYEVYNPELCTNCEDIFVSGWARQAGEGIVGLARKDAERGARAVMQYLAAIEPLDPHYVNRVLGRLPGLEGQFIDVHGLERLWAVERQRAVTYFTNEEMLNIIKEDE